MAYPPDWQGVAAHVHTKADLPERECQGEQTYAQAAETAQARGLKGLLITEHTTNPGVGKPHRFTVDDPLGQALLAHLRAVKGDAEVQARTGVKLYAGVEANILEDGLDIPLEIARECDFIIASFHGEVPRDTDEFERRFMMTCTYAAENSLPLAIGHPWRYVEERWIDWIRLFRDAQICGVAIEANFNAWNTYGPGKLRRRVEAGQAAEEDLSRAIKREDFLYSLLGETGASVLKSLDIHRREMWPRKQPLPDAPWQPTEELLAEFDALTARYGFTGPRVINSSVELFDAYLARNSA